MKTKKFKDVARIALMWLLMLLMVWAMGCKSKKTVIEKVETNRSDTLILKTKTIESPPILSSLTINEICDSITGESKDFNQTFIIEGDTLELSIKNNELKLYNNRLKRTVSQQDSVLRAIDKERNEYKITEIIIYRTPFKIWVILVLMGVIIVGLVYWIIKR